MKPRPYRTADEIGREMACTLMNYPAERRLRILRALLATLAELGVDWRA